MKHCMILSAILLGLVSQGSCVKKRLFFGDYSDSESSESSNSTESDEWMSSLLSIFRPYSTTTRRPVAAGSKIPITTTTSRPPIIKCSNQTSDPCPTDCLTDSAIIHGFCCNCKNPIGQPKNVTCPANLHCPIFEDPLCPDYMYLLSCCCSKKRHVGYTFNAELPGIVTEEGGGEPTKGKRRRKESANS